MNALAILSAILLITPGALNPAVTQANIQSTVCVKGWTATVRSSRSWAYRTKRRMMAEQHLSGRFILDHKVPLELGGAPTDPANLMLQAPKAARAKDTDENRARKLVCAGRWTLAQGQSVFLNWTRP